MENTITGGTHITSYRIPTKKIVIPAPLILETAFKDHPGKGLYQLTVFEDQLECRPVKVSAMSAAGIATVRPNAAILAKALL